MKRKRPRPDDLKAAAPGAAGRRADFGISLLILCCASILFLSNLGGQCLWQDEAQTAMISTTVLSHAIPLGYDGKNYFSQETGGEYGEDYIWKWHTWFPFYLLAGFFAIFGKSTFVARLPFALFGIATVVAAYLFAGYLWKSRRAATVAAILLMLSVPFLILARQCRYYSPAIFFSLLALYAYCILLERKRHAAPTFVIASTLLFNSHYSYFAALLGTVIAHSLVFHRDKCRSVMLASACSLVINIPWIVWLSGMNYGGQGGSYFLKWSLHLRMAWEFLTQTARYIFPPLLLLVPIGLAATGLVKDRRLPRVDRSSVDRLMLLVLFSAFTLILFAVTAPSALFRYLGPMIPVCCLIMARIIESAMKVDTAIGITILLAMGYASQMPDYLYEITHEFRGPIEGIVGYLNEHGTKNDVVAITYEDLPVKFYTGMRVVGGLTGEDLTAAKNADWLILRKYQLTDIDRKVAAYFASTHSARDYERIVLDYPDTAFENRESPDLHRFRTADSEDPVVIYRRIAR